MIALLGGIVGGIVIAMYMPIFEPDQQAHGSTMRMPNLHGSAIASFDAHRRPGRRQHAAARLGDPRFSSTGPESFPVDPFFFLIGLTYALSVALPRVAAASSTRHPWLADVQFGGRRDARLGVHPRHRRHHQLLLVALRAADHRGQHGPLPARRAAGRDAERDAVSRRWSWRSTRTMTSASGGSWQPLTPAELPTLALRAVHRRDQSVRVLRRGAAVRVRWPKACGRPARGSRMPRTQIADLRAFNEYVIDSLLSGLVTADCDEPHPHVQPRGIDDHGPAARAGDRPRRRRGAAVAATFHGHGCERSARRRSHASRSCSTDRRWTAHRHRPDGDDAVVARRAGRLPVHVPGRHGRQAARARRAHPAAAGGGRRDGRGHRPRNPQPARLDVGIDPGAARRNCRSPTSRRS